ncbi:hypothetical protein Aerorivi_02750 [Aeromonas rivipollensis]|uniref:DUF3037 domain-containing protein n=1 Tax=Aeromonas TaxID=642 RepID=UPI0022E1B352|nr:DUF3037 domain-containing protein [Aeromonas sp. QDB30]
MKHEVLYATVQFRPYRETEEFANVGVVMCAPKVGFFDYRLETRSFLRVTNFFSDLDRQLPNRATHYVASELERVKQMTARGYTPEGLRTLFQEVTKVKEGIIYYSHVRPAIMDGELQDTLDGLYQHYVHHSFAKHPSATEQLERSMRTLLEQHDLRKYYQQRNLEDALGLVKANIPFTHQKNGKTMKAIRPLSLMHGTPNKIVEHAEQWAGRFTRLFSANIVTPETVLLPIAEPDNQQEPGIAKALNMARNIFTDSHITTVSANDEEKILTFAAQI